jgi:hypothetical protein
MKNQTKIASSPTIAGLEKLLNQHYYSTTYKIDENTLKITNSKGVFDGLKVVKSKNRYYLVRND